MDEIFDVLMLGMNRNLTNYALHQSEIAGKRVFIREILMGVEQIKSKGVN